MNWHQDLAGESPDLEQALKHFKASMDAWSDAALSRPRTAPKMAVRHSWRMAAGWALGCLLAAGSLAGVVHEIYHRQQMARQPGHHVERKAREGPATAAQPIKAESAGAPVEKKVPAVAMHKVGAGAQESASAQDEDLLASVDNDVSREVPAAMEPLAQLMDENGTQ